MLELDRVVNKIIIDKINDNEYKEVCDYGCGKGELLKTIISSIGKRPNYTGIDFFSKYKLDVKGQNNLFFIDRDSDKFASLISSKKFDFIFSTFALHHFQFPISELKRIFSMLKKDGELLFIDFNWQNKSKSQVVKNYSSFIDEFLNKIKGRYHRHHYSIEEAKDLLSIFDSDNIECYEVDYAEPKEGNIEILENLIKRNNLKTKSLEHAPEIYQDIFNDLFSLEKKLLGKYGCCFNSLIVLSVKKVN